jgi:hypothetical protein
MGLAGVMDGQDMGMLKPRRELDLSEEALGPERGRQFRAQHLERNRAVVSEIVGQKHRGQPPRPSSRSSRYRSARPVWSCSRRSATQGPRVNGTRVHHTAANHPREGIPAELGALLEGLYRRRNGQGGIRTLEGVAPLPVFETGSFSHSDTCPGTASTLYES